MKGHIRYTFVGGGSYGKTFSKPKEVEGINLLEKIARMFERVTVSASNTEFIFSLSKRIDAVVAESDERFRATYNSMIRSFVNFEQEFAFSFMRINVFIYLTNISWAVGVKT